MDQSQWHGSVVVVAKLSQFIAEETHRTTVASIIQEKTYPTVLYFTQEEQLNAEQIESLLSNLYYEVYVMKQEPLFDFSIVLQQFNPNLLMQQGLKIVDTPFRLTHTLKAPVLAGQASQNPSGDRGAIGGTFDHLHIGHKLLISMGLTLSDTFLTIGISGDELLKNKQNREVLQCYATRQRVVAAFASLFRPSTQLDLVELHEPAGPTATGLYDMVILTEETKTALPHINSLREGHALPPLRAYVVQLIADYAKVASKISSSYIRQHILDKNRLTLQQYQFIKERWIEIGYPDTSFFEEVVVARYSEPQRHYHTLEHLLSMLTLFEEIRADLVDKAVVLAAIFFHDIIYNPKSSTNEDDSVVVYQQFCKDASTTVIQLIQATKQHKLNGQQSDLKYFLDLDLAILGYYSIKQVRSSQYAQYSLDIRAEYAHYDDASYRKGRAAVLKGFLKREQLYFTERFQSTHQAAAVQNLTAEIAQLE